MHGISISDAKLKKNYRGTGVKVTTRSLPARSGGLDRLSAKKIGQITNCKPGTNPNYNSGRDRLPGYRIVESGKEYEPQSGVSVKESKNLCPGSLYTS